MIRPEGLREIAAYARAIGVHKSLVVPRDARGRSLAPTTLVEDAHAVGLLVHVWTLRAENDFLPAEFRRGADAAAAGDMAGEARLFLRAGVDGFFTDHPAIGLRAREPLRP
jgi:glycerophosphoryl diester phosphodiesterase